MFKGVVKAELSVCIGTVSEKEFFRTKNDSFFLPFSDNGQKISGEVVKTAF